MKNIDVIKAFVNSDKACHTKNLRFEDSDIDRLINYNTTLAEFDYDTRTFYLNRTKYSVSTSKIQTYLNRELLRYKDLMGDSVTMVDIYSNVPEGTRDLKRWMDNN